MGFVLPEIEDVGVVDLSEGNAIGRIQDGENGFVALLVVRVALELFQRDIVVLFDPFELLLALDVLEPDIGIIARVRGE